jgi:hypothetical protein
LDLKPRTVTVTVPAPKASFSVVLDPESTMKEITRVNNHAVLRL